MSKTSSETPQWYETLIDWIKSGGGHVHEALELTLQNDDDGVRGIASRAAIPKGDTLIRLPPSLALSGEPMPTTYSLKDETRHASSWLKCLGALYKASTEADSFYRPYLDSLPSDYEHLLQWSNEEEVKVYLKGTTLGSIVETERSQGTLSQRYCDMVRPYLAQKNVCALSRSCSGSEHDEQQEHFRQCCMTISTRGFHLQSTSTPNDTQQQDYSGPFLLPFIDLLNHNPALACTVLRRDESNGTFFMMAERDIATGEQVFHSYGNDLTSAQVLQTFGFVPDESIQRASRWNATTGLETDDEDTNDTTTTTSVTAAMLSRDDVIGACSQMMTSEYPFDVETHVKMNRAEYEEETWNASSITMPEKRAIDFVSDNLVVDYSDTPLSNELVTLCTLLLLPNTTFEEFMSDSPTLVDASVLQDYFLGKLVCKSLLVAIDNKMKTYGSSNNSLCDDASKLRVLYNDNKNKTCTEMRAMYGLTIRIEERACLEKLGAQVSKLMAGLDDDDDDDSDDANENDGNEGSGKCKRDNS